MRMANKKRVSLCFAICFALFCSVAFDVRPAGAEDGYKTYANGRFDYSIEYPDIFWSRFESDNGDGVALNSANGHYSLAVWGRHNIEGASAGELLESRLEQSAHIVHESEASGDGWYTFITTDDGGFNGIEHYHLEYGIVTKDTIAAFVFDFPINKGAEAMAERLKKSLRFGAQAGDALEQFDLYAWSPEYELNVEEETVYRVAEDGQKAAGKAESVQTEMGIYYWFAVSPEADDVMKGSQDGIYLFYETGDFVCFLPYEDAEFAGYVKVSPEADYFLIDFGTAPERDLYLYDFLNLKQKQQFLALEAITWVDARNFAMTYVDQTTQPRSQDSFDSGWFSVVVYDADSGALKYVRQATETSDFMLDEADLEAKKFAIHERSVKKPEDWADESKIERRDYKIDF